MQASGVTVIRIFLEVRISLPYHPMFCLNECIIFAFAFSLERNLLLVVIHQLM